MTAPLDMSELRTLLDALCEETQSPEQMRRLEELLLAHPEAEAYYVQYMHLHADLVRHFAASTEQTLRQRLAQAQATPVRQRMRLRWGAVGLLGMAAGLLLTLTLVLRPHGEQSAPAPKEVVTAERNDDTVAVLLQAPGAVWEESDLRPRAGAPLLPGRLRLKSGYAHVEFYSGARVILEGPADFQLVTANEGYCSQGKLRAIVPPQAQGFTIRSPRLDVIDRGTEFGLQIDRANTEVHVFQGKVEWSQAGAPKERQVLTTGQAIRVEGAAAARAIEPDSAAFLTAQDLEARHKAEARQRQDAWLRASAELRKDPDLLVYYPFQVDEPWSRTVRDEAADRKRPRDGAIVGCTWGTGRWPGKHGLEFKRVSDRIRLNVPGDYESISLLAWVRVDSLPNRFNSLFMTVDWEEGAPHWHIHHDGVVELGVQGFNRKNGAHYNSPVVITPERFGLWTHLAVVYDAEAGQVAHYVDGQPVAQMPVKYQIPLRLGEAEVGNWNIGKRKHLNPVRNFSGAMDEFLLFSRALSEEEVHHLYAQGRPRSRLGDEQCAAAEPKRQGGESCRLGR